VAYECDCFGYYYGGLCWKLSSWERRQGAQEEERLALTLGLVDFLFENLQ
jgi:hypothetical protein